MPRWRPPATVEDLNLEKKLHGNRGQNQRDGEVRELLLPAEDTAQSEALWKKGSAPCVGWKQRQLTVCLSVSLVPLAKAWII